MGEGTGHGAPAPAARAPRAFKGAAIRPMQNSVASLMKWGETNGRVQYERSISQRGRAGAGGGAAVPGGEGAARRELAKERENLASGGKNSAVVCVWAWGWGWGWGRRASNENAVGAARTGERASIGWVERGLPWE